MSLYLARARYTADAFKGMIAKPEDRAAPVKALFEAAGAKLLHIWFSPSTLEAIMIAEGNVVAEATVPHARNSNRRRSQVVRISNER